MKVVFDLSVTSAVSKNVVTSANWNAAWNSPLSGASPGLVLDFVADVYGTNNGSENFDSVVSLTRNSNATRTDAVGAIDLVGPHIARISHDPVSLAPLGLLLEPARTNLVTDSGAPASQDVTVTAAPHVLSFYGDGTVSLSGAQVGAYVGSGAYPVRTEVAFTPTAGILSLAFSGQIIAPQIEIGATASSYIPSGAAAEPRGEDVANVALGSWFNPAEGTVVFSGTLDSALANDRIFEIDTGATSSRLSLLWNTVLGKPQFQIWDGGALQAAIAPPGNSINLGDHFRVAVAYSDNSFSVSLNGSSLASDSSGTVPQDLATLRLGRSIWGAQCQMVAEGLTYYPNRLSDAEVQALSA
jgi:hypothetical protein